MQHPVRITVNGDERRVPPGTSVADLLTELALPLAAVAVEKNRRIVRREAQRETVLEDGDALEIVTLIGGG